MNSYPTYLRHTALLAVAMLALTACSNKKKYLPAATGKPYEVIVVADDAVWNGPLGDTVRSIMDRTMPMINRDEPLFDMVRTDSAGIRLDLVRKHHNQLYLRIEDKFTAPGIHAVYDRNASGQIVVLATANNADSLAVYLSQHAEELFQALGDHERKLYISKVKPAQAVIGSVKSRFGIGMTIPWGYTLKKDEPDFLWVNNELPLATQGMFVYSYDIPGTEQLTVRSLIDARNHYLQKYVPGPSDDSYMTTVEEIVPATRLVDINGETWVEMRGYWDVKGDFMGGPFVSYSTIRGNKAYTIDCFVFSPHYPQRTLLRQLESMVYTAQFAE